ncbi:MAG: RluA family pseudouridine synthase [bacterium]
MKKERKKRQVHTHKNFTVKRDEELLKYLIEIFNDQSRNTIKSYLAHRQIAVNGKTETLFSHMLKTGDNIRWSSVGEQRPNPNHKVKIIYEDDDIIVVDKKNGVLTMSTGKEGEQTAYSVMTEHVRRRHRDNRIFIVHRLDRDTSGLLLFAKSEEVQQILQHNWNENIISRTYVAVVEGKPAEEKGKVVSWLTENERSLKMQSSPTDNGGKKAITNYNLVKDNGRYSLIELNLETGRKNQIRVQMASIGHPIAGDKRYGAQSNPLGRLCLHARTISFMHPITREIMRFDTDIPKIFR